MEAPNTAETSLSDAVKPHLAAQNQDGQETDAKTQTDMADSLKRSITLVIWYKPGANPIRLNHHVPSFPLFQMSHFPQLVSELNLSAESYIDAYNDRTGQWEQHMITTVRSVESEQRLLYKVRKSLFVGLNEEECVGLGEELALQAKAKDPQTPMPSPFTTNNKTQKAVKFQPVAGKKRSAPDEPSASASPAAKYHITEFSQHPYIVQHPTQTYPQNLSSPPGHIAGASPLGAHGHITHVYPYQAGLAQYAAAPLMALPPSFPPPFPHQTPQHPHATQGQGAAPAFHGHPPAVKRWPNDYTVAEVTLGFAQMDGLMTQTPSITQRVAFERVFGTRYVKSTVCRHRGVWKRAGKGVGSLGNGEREMWGDFVRRIEGRRGEVPPKVVLPGSVGQEGVTVSAVSAVDREYNDRNGSGSADASGDQEEEEDDADAEAVMGSLGPPPLGSDSVQGVPAPVVAAATGMSPGIRYM
ncbi:hypothetical protein NEOLEDRAFT_1180237 [Neolentinus lepideus HHB14362 ss-1]|uniref:Uncharacterized protein n=1 Tax=Neolentinus lepideus HHB14362 ss-1 TaxID=1314782 RepID=A0A165R1M9_9AGAM|nr:hypothetical protein NEOLEDRAFT_1180237 [Neolentinus lepideus HHB14362 ss-1]